MGTREGNTADATRCTGCGEPFVSGSGPYIRHGFVGMYHKRCLPLWPAPDLYRSGLIAGLREAAERCSAISANPTWSAEMISVYECALADAEASIRARVTALEEEGSREH